MTTDRDGPRSNPYRPTEMACEACCFGRGGHTPWCVAGMGNTITVTNHYIRRKDGTTTMVRTCKGIVLEVNEDVPVIWPESNPAWIADDRLESPRCLELMLRPETPNAP